MATALSLSTERNTTRGLRAITERGEWEGWLMYMLEAVEATAHGTTEKINAIRDLLAENSRHREACFNSSFLILPALARRSEKSQRRLLLGNSFS